MNKLFFKFLLFVLLLAITTTGCNKRRYPCPGNGTASARDLSVFDEEGNLKSERNKKQKKDNGLVSKKQDDRLKNRRKRFLNDTPKNLKK